MRILRITVLSVLALVVILVTGITVLALTLDPNDHKDRIEGLVREQTGLELQLTGPMELTLYPWLGITLSDVSVDSGDGQPFMQVDHARARAQLLPLLRGRYEIDTVQLYGATLDLVIDEQGRGNWETLLAESAADESETADSATPQWPAALALGGVDIRDTRITLDDRQQNRRVSVEDLTVRTGELLYGEPIDLFLSADTSVNRPELRGRTTLEGLVTYSDDGRLYHIEPFTVETILSGPAVPGGETALNLSAPARLDLAAETMTLDDVSLTGAGLNLEASASLSGLGGSPSGEATLDLRGDDMATLFRIAALDDLADRIENLGDRTFSLSAGLEADSALNTLTIRDLQADLLGSRIEGTLEQSGEGRINGQLQAEGPDLPLLMTVAGQLQGGGATTLAHYGEQLQSLPDRSFQMRSDFDLDLDNGRVDIPTISAAALGMELDGGLTASDLFSSSASAEGNLEASGDDLPALLRAIDQPDLANTLQSFRLNSRISGQGSELVAGPLDLTVALTDPARPDDTLDVRLQTQAEHDADNGTLTLPYFTLSGAGLDVDGRLNVTGLEGAPEFQGQLYIGDTDLRQLAGRFGMDLPPMRDDDTLRRLAFEAEFSGSASQLSTSNLQLRLDDTTVSGTLIADLEGTPADINLDLNVDRLNVDRYLPPADARTDGTEDGPPPAALPLALLQAGNARGVLSAGELTIAGVQLNELRIGYSGSQDRLELAPVETLLYGGRFEGDIEALISDGTTISFTSNANLQAVNLAPLLRDLADASNLSGLANMELSLDSSGDTLETLRGNLSGTGQMALEDGVLYGVSVGGTLAQLETMIRSRRLMSLDRGESTPFEELTATLDINSGVIRSDDLRLLAPGFQVTGQGVLLDLNDNSIAYDLDASVDRATATTATEEYDIGGYTVPIACRGNVESPSCTPDIEAILRRALGNEIERRLGDFLRNL